MAVLYTNNASTLLTASITNAATSFSVTAGTGSLFPVVSGSDYFYITLVDNAGNYEIVKVTGRSTDTFTITRGQDGTSARAFSVGDKVELRIVRAMLDDLKGERLPLTGGTLTGILNISPNFGISTSTVDFGAVVKFDNSYSDGARGPNKVVLYNDVGNWLSGLGIHNNTLAVYSGGLTTFYSGTTGYNAVGTATLSFDASSISYKGNALLHAGNYTDYAAPASHTHSYLPLSGGAVSGYILTETSASSWGVYSKTSGYENYSGIWFSSNVGELLLRKADGSLSTRIAADGSYAFINGNNILHAGNYSSYAAPASHTHSYLPLGGGTLTGKVIAGSSDGDSIEVRNDTASAASSGYITFKNKNGIGVYRPAARISGANVDNAYDGDFLIETYSGGVAYKGLRVDENSDVFFYDTSGNVKFQWEAVNSRALINSNVVLHAGNYTNYAAPASHTHSYLPLSGGTLTNNLKIQPVDEGWAEGLSFLMPTTSKWGGLRWQRQRGNYDGNWYIGYTALDSSDDLVFGANNGGSQVDNILRLTKSGSVSMAGPLTLNSGATFYSDGSSRAMYLRGSGNIIQFCDEDGTFRWENVGRNGTYYIYKGYGTGAGYKFQINDIGEVRINGDIAVTAGNYTSYSPSLTGSGASGTWGINVTGYAAQLNGYGQQTEYTILDGPANGPVIKVRYDGATANRYIDIGYKDGYGTYYSALKFYNGDILTLSGNIGLGVSPDIRLSVNGEAHISSYLYMGGTAGSKNSWGSRDYTSGSLRYINANYFEVNNYGYGSTWSFAVDGSSSRYNGNVILHAGNSTNYDAYRASGQGGYPHAGWGMFAFYNWGGSNGGASAPSSSSYTVGLSVGSHPSDQAYGFQIARNMWNTGLWTRGYDSGWGSWVRLLDSSNYSSYALPLGGGTLTGSLTVGRDVVVAGQTGGNYGNRIVVGAYDTAYTLQDGNLRPTIQANGQYPVLSLNHTVTSNTNHGPTIQMTANGVGNQFVIGMTGNGTALDMGYSSTSDWNPHNGIAGYSGTTFFRATSGGFLGLGAPGDWGGVGGGDPQYHLHVKGYPTWTQGYAGVFQNTGGSNGGGWLFQNDAGNHSWGATAEFRVNGTGDRPSIIFSTAAVDTSWSIGYVTGSDDTFRISKNHGHRAYYNGWADNNSGWGTAYFSITSAGVASANGGTLLSSSNYSSYALPLSGGTISGDLYVGGRNLKIFENNSYIEFYVGGDANTYYPVRFDVYAWMHWGRWSISRGYSDTAPWDPIGTGAHRGGLTLTWEWSGDGAWGGNDHAFRVVQFSEQYTTMVGGMALSVNGMIVWLRGGNAYYRFHGPGGVGNGATPYYSTYTASNGTTYPPRSYDSNVVASEISWRFPVRYNGEFYEYNNRVLNASNYSSYALPLSGGTMSGAITMGGNNVNNAGQFSLNNGFTISQGGSNYGQFSSWVHLPGYHGFYSANNSAHFYPNDGSYGSWRSQGTRNGWGGINFSNNNNGDVTLMVHPNSNETGFYNPSYGWQIYWTGGALYVGKNSYGGNNATVLDSSNYTSYSPSYSSGGGFTGQWQFYSNLGGYCGSLSGPGLQAYATGSNSAFMSFHRGGYYAVNMGLDADNVLRIGGWSAAANRWSLDMSGNNYAAGNFYANNSNLVLHSGNYSSYALPLSGGTMSGTIGSSMNDLGRLFASYNASASGPLQFYIDHSYGSVNIGNARGTINFAASGLFFGGQTILTGANVSSYAIPLSGGSVTTSTYVTFSGGFSASSNAYFSSGVYQTVNGIANTDYSNTVSPSLNSINNIASHTYAGKTHVGLNQTAAKRRAQALAGSGGTFGTTYGYLIDEIYVNSSLNAYTVMQQNSWSFISSYATGSLNRHFYVGSESIGPGSSQYDNLMSAGASSARYTIVYATTGTINTSDVNEKEQIQDLDAAERRVAVAVKGLIKKFKWKDAVAKKGDAARIHIGVIAQEVEAAFVAEGLDPERYALFCKDVWWEKMVPNENYGREDAPNEPETILETFQSEVEGGTRKERKGIRYDQLLAFVISAI